MLCRLPILLVMLLSLLNLANYTAFSVIISLSTFGLYQSYLIAILCMFTARLSGRWEEVSISRMCGGKVLALHRLGALDRLSALL